MMNIKKVEQIKDYYTGKVELGEDTQCFGIITYIGTRQTKENSTYTFFTFEDKSAAIHVKAWDTNLVALGFGVGSFICLRGSLEKWKQKTQLTVKANIEGDLAIALVEERHKVNIVDYIPVAPIPPTEMLKEISSWISTFENTELATICTTFFKKYQKVLLYYPGALMVHHAYKAGLLHHMYTMAKRIFLECDLNPTLDKELMLTGIFLHDMGKLRELSGVNELIGRAEDYSKEGVLLGHLAIGLLMLQELVSDIEATSKDVISQSTVLKLQHIIISHHYDEKTGALQKPSFLEAELIHHHDLLDSRENIFAAESRVLLEDEVGPKVPFLDQRRILRSDFVNI